MTQIKFKCPAYDNQTKFKINVEGDTTWTDVPTDKVTVSGKDITIDLDQISGVNEKLKAGEKEIKVQVLKNDNTTVLVGGKVVGKAVGVGGARGGGATTGKVKAPNEITSPKEMYESVVVMERSFTPKTDRGVEYPQYTELRKFMKKLEPMKDRDNWEGSDKEPFNTIYNKHYTSWLGNKLITALS